MPPYQPAERETLLPPHNDQQHLPSRSAPKCFLGLSQPPRSLVIAHAETPETHAETPSMGREAKGANSAPLLPPVSHSKSQGKGARSSRYQQGLSGDLSPQESMGKMPLDFSRIIIRSSVSSCHPLAVRGHPCPGPKHANSRQCTTRGSACLEKGFSFG